VQNVWARPQNAPDDPTASFVRSLKWTRVECKRWVRGRNRLDTVVAACNLVVELLDLLEEVWLLTTQERLLRRLVVVHRSLVVKELAVYWRQRFSFKLCKFGDENTTFYHASVSAHLRSNKIQVLHEDGVSTYTHAAKEHILHAFYVGLLSTSSTAVMPQHLLGLLPAVSGLSTLEAPVLAF
jgi:hypothetical protein